MKEQVKFWRSPQFADLELLHARFITHSFCRHTHNGYAIGVIQQGAEEFTYRGSTHVAQAGSIALINPGEPHDGHAASEGGWMYRMLYPDVSILQAAMADLWRSPNVPYFPHPVVQDEYIKGLLLRLHVTLEASPCQLEQDSRMVWTMAQLIARHAGDRPPFKPIGKESNPIQLVQDYLETHYAENSSLEELAAIANLSPFYLLRAFRKQVGLPPHSYLNQVRLHRAKTLLAQGKSISEVAQETGFADQSHLT